MLEKLVGHLDLEITDTIPTQFYCNCSKERVEQAVASIGKKDIQEMIDEGKEIEVKCHFCNTAYNYTVEDLKNILKRSKKYQVNRPDNRMKKRSIYDRNSL